VVYTAEGLATKTGKELKEICQRRSLPYSGKKADLAARILKLQHSDSGAQSEEPVPAAAPAAPLVEQI